MPHRTESKDSTTVSLDTFSSVIRQLLDDAKNIKPEGGIEPPITAQALGNSLSSLDEAKQHQGTTGQNAHYAPIETVIRSIFYDILVKSAVDDSHDETWNLLDLVTIFADTGQCEPALVFWLIEELLDSQTIEGCKRVFDYLESRRERLTARDFKNKQLVILRACNELLRRLSRAEDTVFCGRVFIFLFQSFPLGDRSSVNLRGEYHSDNVTIYDHDVKFLSNEPTKMDVDSADEASFVHDTPMEANPEAQGSKNEPAPTEIRISKPEGSGSAKESSAQESRNDSVLDLNALYPVFWSLQEYFAYPPKLFDEPSALDTFKSRLEATLAKFQQARPEGGLRAAGSSASSDEVRQGLKRKRGPEADTSNSSFNPKYLTSPDLFELEINDLAFRRHILVQALITIDFLLSLTPKAKAKVESSKNRAVVYAYTLSEQDAKWATDMRSNIANYLSQGPDGKFYYRMVDTVLSRDKNWVRWKAESCPEFHRPAIGAGSHAEAKATISKMTANRKIKQMPLGALDLNFLSESEVSSGFEKLKDPERYTIPSLESFRGPVEDDNFDYDRAKTDEERQLAADARASKLWRALRIASRSKFGKFEKIDDGKNLDALFVEEDPPDKGSGDDAEGDDATAQESGIRSEEQEEEEDEDVQVTVSAEAQSAAAG